MTEDGMKSYNVGSSVVDAISEIITVINNSPRDSNDNATLSIEDITTIGDITLSLFSELNEVSQTNDDDLFECPDEEDLKNFYGENDESETDRSDNNGGIEDPSMDLHPWEDFMVVLSIIGNTNIDDIQVIDDAIDTYIKMPVDKLMTLKNIIDRYKKFILIKKG